MKISAIELVEKFPELLKYGSGDKNITASKPLPPENCTQGALAFASDTKQAETAIKKNAAILILPEKLHSQIMLLAPLQICLLTTRSISQAMTEVNRLFDRKIHAWPVGIHPTAQIDPSASLGKGTRVGAFSVIGADVEMGPNCFIGSHVVIEAKVILGSKVLIHSHVTIRENCELGSGCEIHPQTVIGSDGYGYTKDASGQNIKIPQIGRVVLEDEVELGSFCAIDRATLFETRIGKQSKLDNHCHIGHNCQIGQRALITAGFYIAGSSCIGDDFSCGGNTVVSDHVNICAQVSVGGRSSVTKDITEPGAYVGYPLEKLKDGLRTIASLPSVVEMRKELAEIKKKLKLD